MTRQVGSEERRKERTILAASLMDAALIVIWLVLGVFGGSLTIIAEAFRGFLMLLIELVGLWVMRRLHRSDLHGFDFGTIKLEYACNTGVALMMFGGAIWIAAGAVSLFVAGHTEATPLGLALAAAASIFNLWVNFVAFVALLAASRGDSIILAGQIKSRLVKLVSSIVVQIAMTVAAVSTDPVVAAWADGLGACSVALVMLLTSFTLMREAAPHLLDRRGPEKIAAETRALAQQLVPPGLEMTGMRTRGGVAGMFAEIAIAHRQGATLADIDLFEKRLEAELARRDLAVEITIRLARRGARRGEMADGADVAVPA